MKHRPETYQALGDIRAQAALAAETAPVLKQQYREEARLAYQHALAENPDYRPAHLALARLFDALGEADKAIASYTRALELQENDPIVWHERGMCQCRHKDWAGAIESLTRASALDPDNRKYRVNLGFALGEAGKLQESLTVLAQVGGEARAHYNLGRMLQHRNQPELARQHLELAIRKDPKLVEAHSALSQMHTSDQGIQTTGYSPSGIRSPFIETPTPGSAPSGKEPQTVPRIIQLSEQAKEIVPPPSMQGQGLPRQRIAIPPPPMTTSTPMQQVPSSPPASSQASPAPSAP